MAVETLEEERSCEGSSEASEEHSEEEEEKGEQVPRTVLARTRRSLAQQQLETSSSQQLACLTCLKRRRISHIKHRAGLVAVWKLV